ncbi:PAS domain S-box protein [Methanoregula sp.]|uniref:hybrid sensor histidine kinase/response regulator n=1 Tax=Methanoregula sp. TaxID=2052170 RepID=UPI002370C7DA|nr:PAS domain S-box protein [Methanoregula sp.]MDD1687654.1 PAS domain S-box protein [Methanoregula sp.]
MISLLHVDSDTALQVSLKEYLERGGGISVVSIRSASEALDLLRTTQFDIIVSEYKLLSTDGQAFLEVLRRNRKISTPFIFFAKKAGNTVVINALNAGATFFVLKGRAPKKEFMLLRHYINLALRQNRLEYALREQEKQYRSVVEDQSEFIFRFLTDGTIVFANDAYCSYFKKPHNVILGRNIQDNISPDYRDTFFHQLQDLTRENPVRSMDSRMLASDGSTLWQQWSYRAIFHDQPVPSEYQAVGRDITAQKNAESALVQAHRNLGVMNTITRHDILNQLTGVFGYLEIARQCNADGKIDECLKRAYHAAETIRGQITFTKEYQEIGCSAAQWQNMDHLIGKAISELDLSGIRIDYDLENLGIFADPLVEKVFYNLMENSLRHGKRVSEIRISWREEKDGLVIVYEDNGVGVPAGVKEKIFRREYFQNTGLGLYLIREILAITGIRISECGIPGTGARFEMKVPPGNFGFRIDDDPAPDPCSGKKE